MAVRLRFASHYCMSSLWRHTDFRSVDIKASSTINFSFHLNTMLSDSDKIIEWHVSILGTSKILALNIFTRDKSDIGHGTVRN